MRVPPSIEEGLSDYREVVEAEIDDRNLENAEYREEMLQMYSDILYRDWWEDQVVWDDVELDRERQEAAELELMYDDWEY